MKIGLFQSDIFWEDKPSNYIKYENALLSAKNDGIDIVFLPEMSITGFSMNIKKTAEEQNGETISFFKSICNKINIACGFGYTEKCENKAINKYMVCGKNGEILSEYAKIHPFSFGQENEFFIGGNSLSIFDFYGIKISTFICYDLRFPEIFQEASKTCDVIIVAANWPEKRRGHWLTLLKARAIENQTYICGVNRTGNGGGLEYSGDSIVISPNGEIISNAGQNETMIFFDFDKNEIESLRSSFPLKKDRRIDLYKGFYL